MSISVFAKWDVFLYSFIPLAFPPFTEMKLAEVFYGF